MSVSPPADATEHSTEMIQTHVKHSQNIVLQLQTMWRETQKDAVRLEALFYFDFFFVCVISISTSVNKEIELFKDLPSFQNPIVFFQ